MWILPKKLQSSHSVAEWMLLDLDSKQSLENQCKPSDIVSLRGLHKPISSVKWKKDSWMSHLFGRILQPSHTESFTDSWTSQLREYRANHTLRQVSDREEQTNDSYSTSYLTDSNSCNQEQSLSKMSKDSYPQKCQMELFASDTSSDDWSKSDTALKSLLVDCRSEYSVRLKLACHTNENESSYSQYPAPTARDFKDNCEPSSASRNSPPLGTFVHLQDRDSNSTSGSQTECANWPTPDTSDRRSDNSKQQGLSNVVKQRGTPQARDRKGASGRAYKGEANDLPNQVERPTSKRLNPRWVETLMNVPIGWTMPSCTSEQLNDPSIYTSRDNRTDELRLLGNGVVPATASKAFLTLLKQNIQNTT
jgi:hypothetical protein